VVLSGYANAFRDRRLASARRVKRDIANHAAQGDMKRSRTEVHWIKAA
jgi:hypothetical protein